MNEEEAKIVRYIFKRYIEGMGAHVIARELEQMGADIYDVAPKLYKLAVQAIVYLVIGLLLTHIRDKAKIDMGDM